LTIIRGPFVCVLRVVDAMAMRRAVAASRRAVSQQLRFVAAQTYTERFEASVPGSGHRKEDQLKYGGWRGNCDSASLSRLWAQPALRGSQAEQELSLFSSAVEKAPEVLAGLLGRARAKAATEDAAGAMADVDEVLKKAAAGSQTAVYAAALQARIAVTSLRRAERLSGLDDERLHWDQRASAAFAEAERLQPENWQILLAHGKYLVEQNSFLAAEAKLQAAFQLIMKEVQGREGAVETYATQGTFGAVSDYMDHKNQNVYKSSLGDIIGETQPGDAAMEKDISKKYPAKLSDAELQVLSDLDAAIESGDLGFTQPLGAGRVGAQTARNFDHVYANEVSALIDEYAGGELGKLMRSTAPIEDVLAQVEALPNSAPPTPAAVLTLQKRLGVRLAKQTRDQCRTLLGKALLGLGKASEAAEVLGATVKASSYLRMHETFQAYGDALTELGRIDEADKAYKQARELDMSPAGVDIPTIDEKAFRDVF